MKQLIYIFFIILIVSSCKKDEPKPDIAKPVLTVPHDYVELEAGETFQIIASGGESFNYQSNREFVATVSSAGIIKANKVGRAHITVLSTAGSLTINVKVIGKINLYEEPFTNFNLTRNEIIAQLGNPIQTEDDYIAYASTNPAVFRYVYNFDSSSKLKRSAAIIEGNYVLILLEYLDERYEFYGETDRVYFYLNDESVEKATIVIGLKEVIPSNLSVGYMPKTLSNKFKMKNLSSPSNLTSIAYPHFNK